MENKQNKDIKRPWITWIIGAFGAFLSLPLLIFVLLFVPTIQRYTVDFALNKYLLDNKHHLEIEYFYLSPLKTLSIHSLRITDEKKTAFISFDSLYIEVEDINFNPFHLKVGQFKLVNPVFQTLIYSGDSISNFSKFLTLFQSTSADTNTAKTPFDIKIDMAQIHNGVYEFWDENLNQLNHEVDYNHIFVKSLTLITENVSINDENIRSNIKHLTLRDTSGFELKNFQTLLLVNDSVIAADSLFIKSGKSALLLDFAMEHKNYKGFSDFVNEVYLHTKIYNSNISAEDIAYFVEDLYGLQEKISIKGQFKGTVNNFRLREVEMSFFQNSYLSLNARVSGLPDLKNTFLNLKINDLTTTKEQLQTIALYPFSSNRRLGELPDIFNEFKKIQFSGNLSGFYNDFVAFGELNTNVGVINSDIQFFEQTEGNYTYQGELKAKRLFLGSILKDKNNFGYCDFDLSLEGEGIEIEKLATRITGKISNLDIYGYSYKNIKIGGNFKGKMFKGNLTFKDPNGDFAFDGKMNFNPKLPEYDFTMSLDSFYVKKFLEDSFMNRFSDSSLLELKVQSKFSGNSLNNLSGKLKIHDLSFFSNDSGFTIDSMVLTGKGVDTNRVLLFESDYVTAAVEGVFNTSEIGKAVINVLGDAFPKLIEGEKNNNRLFENFTLRAQIEVPKNIYELFYPDFHQKEAILINAKFDEINKYLDFELICESFYLKKLGRVKGFYTTTTLDNKVFSVINEIEEIQITDTISIQNLSTVVKGLGNRLQFSSNWENSGNYNNYKGDISGLAKFTGPRNLELDLLPSQFSIGDSVWNVNTSSSIYIDTQKITVPLLTIFTDKSRLAINGEINRRKPETLNLNFVDFNLELINLFVPKEVIHIEGLLNGQTSLTDPVNNLILNSSLQIEDFKFNGEFFGSGSLLSEYDGKAEKLALDANLKHLKTLKNISLVGDYYPFKESETLDLKLKAVAIPFALIEPFTAGQLSNLRGNLGAFVDIKGSLKQPEISGKIDFDTLQLFVEYTKTDYTILPNHLFVESDWIGVDLLKIKDQNEGNAVATSTITHENFENFYLDVILDANKLKLLNTNKKDNDLFYGSAPGTGTVSIDGFLNQIDVKAKMQTDRPTSISLPLDGSQTVSENQFIYFKDFSDTTVGKGVVEEKQELNWLTMNFEIDITNDAELKIIFDEIAGDIMRVEGQGNIILNIDQNGDFFMFGNYEINNGDYLFTLQNVINKRFKLSKGSSISWSGDPLAAQLDIKAVYKSRTNLKSLGLPLDSNQLNRRIPVDLELIMKNNLMSPDITFNISLPGADAEIQSILDASLATEEQINRQVFSLLLLNRFAPIDESTAEGGGGVGSNSYELLSNQLSNWLSQFSDKLDVGVDYRGNANTEDELSVAVSTQLLNDRVLLEGSVGNVADPGQTQNNSSIVGDFMLQYLLTENGKIRARVYNKSNDFNSVNANVAPYTQGIGVSYREDFNTWSEFFQKINFFKKSKDKK